MLKGIALEVESFFIINQKVFKVFRIEQQIDKGQGERVIHYRPYYLDDNNKTLVCSIPESNISQLNPCKPISKMAMFKLLMFLSEKPLPNNESYLDNAQSALDSNDIYKIVSVLKSHWFDSQENKATKSLQKDTDNLIKRVAEELALLFDTSREHARAKIIAALGEHAPVRSEA